MVAPIYYPFYFWNVSMIHLWNFIFDGWIPNPQKQKETKIEIKDRPLDKNSRLVPDNWKSLGKEKMIGLARDLTGEKYKTKAEAERAIKKVLKR